MIVGRKNNLGFTLVEILVVVVIIGLIATLALTSLSSARLRSRDVRRIADMRAVGSAMFMYYNREGLYPTIITSGHSLVSVDGRTIYMQTIPTNPTPQNDSPCDDVNYLYSTTPANDYYHIYFCTGGAIDQISGGAKFLTANGFENTAVPGSCGGFFNGTCGAGQQCCPSQDVNKIHCYGDIMECVSEHASCTYGVPSWSCANAGEPCSTKEDCLSGVCQSNVCACYNDGFACVANSNCCGGTCRHGICQSLD